MAKLAENSLFTFNPFIGNFNNYGDGPTATDQHGVTFFPAKDGNNNNIIQQSPKALNFAPSVSTAYANLQWQYLYCRTTYNWANMTLSSPGSSCFLIFDGTWGTYALTANTAPTSSDIKNSLAWAKVTNTGGALMIESSDMRGWNFVFENKNEGTTTAISGTNDQQGISHNKFSTFVGAYKITQTQGDSWTTYGNTKYWDGYRDGKRDGIAEANGTINGFEVIGQAFEGVGGFLSKELLPGISFGTLISVPILVTLIAVVIRILKK